MHRQKINPIPKLSNYWYEAKPISCTSSAQKSLCPRHFSQIDPETLHVFFFFVQMTGPRGGFFFHFFSSIMLGLRWSKCAKNMIQKQKAGTQKTLKRNDRYVRCWVYTRRAQKFTV